MPPVSSTKSKKVLSKSKKLPDKSKMTSKNKETRSTMALRHRPHEPKKSTKSTSARTPPVSAPGPLPTSTHPPIASSSHARTLRDVCLRSVRRLYPYFEPRNDFDILCLSDAIYKGPEEGIIAYLEDELARFAPGPEYYQEAVRKATKILDQRSYCTGAKPFPGDPGVFVRPIPNSKYAIRLFPGSGYTGEYCLDFVDTTTGEAVNSPFAFELFCGPGPSDLTGSGPIVQIQSLERSCGIAQHKIPPGQEKFVLRDGLTCTLRRPGNRDVMFKVPTRRRPEPPRPANVDVLDLPEYIAPTD